MNIETIHPVEIAAPAGCEEPARRFYGTLLGLEVEFLAPAVEELG